MLAAALIATAALMVDAKASPNCNLDTRGTPAEIDAACTMVIADPKANSEDKALAYRRRGYERHTSHDARAAHADYTAALDLGSSVSIKMRSHLFRLRSNANESLGDMPSALKDIQTSLELDSTNASAHQLLATLLDKIGDANGRDAAVDRAIALDPADYWARLDRARWNFYRGSIERSLVDTQALISRTDSSMQMSVYDFKDRRIDARSAAVTLHANSLALVRRQEDGAALLDDLVQARQSAYSYSARGEFLLELSRYDEALVDLRKAVELDRSDHQTWYSISGAMWNLRRFHEANAAIAMAINLQPARAWSDPAYRWRQFDLLREEKRLGEAEAVMKSAWNAYVATSHSRNANSMISRLERARLINRTKLEFEPDSPRIAAAVAACARIPACF